MLYRPIGESQFVSGMRHSGWMIITALSVFWLGLFVVGLIDHFRTIRVERPALRLLLLAFGFGVVTGFLPIAIAYAISLS